MKKYTLSPEVWEIIKKYPKKQLSEKQSIFLEEVYDLNDVSDSIKTIIMKNNCVAIDKQGYTYLHYGNIDGFICMLIHDIENHIA